MDKIHTDEQKADLFTKAFDKTRFTYLLKLNGVKDFSKTGLDNLEGDSEDSDSK